MGSTLRTVAASRGLEAVAVLRFAAMTATVVTAAVVVAAVAGVVDVAAVAVADVDAGGAGAGAVAGAAAVEIASVGEANRYSGLSEEKVNGGLGGIQDDPTLCRKAGRLPGQSHIECSFHPKTPHGNGQHQDPTAAADWDPWLSPWLFKYQRPQLDIEPGLYCREK